jgi:hypothetical protein
MTIAFIVWIALLIAWVLFVGSGCKRQVSDPVKSTLEERA